MYVVLSGDCAADSGLMPPAKTGAGFFAYGWFIHRLLMHFLIIALWSLFLLNFVNGSSSVGGSPYDVAPGGGTGLDQCGRVLCNPDELGSNYSKSGCNCRMIKAASLLRSLFLVRPFVTGEWPCMAVIRLHSPSASGQAA